MDKTDRFQHERGEPLFTMRRLFLSYLPRRTLISTIPITAVLAFFVGRESLLIYSGISLTLFSAVSVSNFFHCREKHLDLEAEYGAQYVTLLNAKLEETSLNRLIDRFWLGLEPHN